MGHGVEVVAVDVAVKATHGRADDKIRKVECVDEGHTVGADELAVLKHLLANQVELLGREHAVLQGKRAHTLLDGVEGKENTDLF